MQALKTIRISNLATLAEDLNYNFSTLLSHPSFKGIAGEDGESVKGAQGVRGAAQALINIDDFNTNFGTAFDVDDLDLDLVNTKFISDASAFIDSISTDSLLDGDLLILPDGVVIMYDVSEGLFVDTYLDLVTSDEAVTEERVQELIQSNSGSISSLFYEYSLTKKLVSDASDDNELNLINTTTSIVDVDVSGAEDAFEDITRKIIAFDEDAATSSGTYLETMFIPANANVYYNLVQRTITNGDLLRGIRSDDMPAQLLLQNNSLNGLMMGSSSATSLFDFARIYRSVDALVLTPYNSYDTTNDTIYSLRLYQNSATYGGVLTATNFKATGLTGSMLVSTNTSKQLETSYSIYDSDDMASDFDSSTERAAYIPTVNAVYSFISGTAGLAVKASDESISGEWTFLENLEVYAETPFLWLRQSGDESASYIDYGHNDIAMGLSSSYGATVGYDSNTGKFFFDMVNDGVYSTAMTIDRDTQAIDFYGEIGANNNKIINLADGTDSGDAVNYGQLVGLTDLAMLSSGDIMTGQLIMAEGAMDEIDADSYDAITGLSGYVSYVGTLIGSAGIILESSESTPASIIFENGDTPTQLGYFGFDPSVSSGTLYLGSTYGGVELGGKLNISGVDLENNAHTTPFSIGSLFSINSSGEVIIGSNTVLKSSGVLASLGQLAPDTLRVSKGGIYTYQSYDQPTTAFQYAEVIGFGGATEAQSEIAVSWNGTPTMYMRSLRDSTDSWSSWVKLYSTESDIRSIIASTVSAGDGIDVSTSGNYTIISHADTSDVVNKTTTTTTVITSILFDEYGHVQSVGTRDMDNYYYRLADLDNAIDMEELMFIGDGGVETDGDIISYGSAIITGDISTYGAYVMDGDVIITEDQKFIGVGGILTEGAIDTDYGYYIDGQEVISSGMDFVGANIDVSGYINSGNNYRVDDVEVISSSYTFTGTGGVNTTGTIRANTYYNRTNTDLAIYLGATVSDSDGGADHNMLWIDNNYQGSKPSSTALDPIMITSQQIYLLSNDDITISRYGTTLPDGDTSEFKVTNFATASYSVGTKYTLFVGSGGGSGSTGIDINSWYNLEIESTVGDVSITGDDVTVYGTFNNSSDERLKSDISPLYEVVSPLDTINAMSPKSYTKDNTTEFGFIAQEVEKIDALVSLVKTASGENTRYKLAGVKSINYNSLHALTIAALQEVDAKLESEVSALKLRITELETMIDNLQNS